MNMKYGIHKYLLINIQCHKIRNVLIQILGVEVKQKYVYDASHIC